VNCETDFVARSESFRKFAHEIALQIAAAAPLTFAKKTSGRSARARSAQDRCCPRPRRRQARKLSRALSKGSIKKFKDETVLMRQAYIRDDSMTIQELYNQTWLFWVRIWSSGASSAGS
jgi:elongation factor Ts